MSIIIPEPKETIKARDSQHIDAKKQQGAYTHQTCICSMVPSLITAFIETENLEKSPIKLETMLQ